VRNKCIERNVERTTAGITRAVLNRRNLLMLRTISSRNNGAKVQRALCVIFYRAPNVIRACTYIVFKQQPRAAVTPTVVATAAHPDLHGIHRDNAIATCNVIHRISLARAGQSSSPISSGRRESRSIFKRFLVPTTKRF